MRGKPHSQDMKLKAMDCIVHQGLSIRQTLDVLKMTFPDDKMPGISTISVWAKQKDDKGRDWRDLSNEHKAGRFALLNPMGMASKMYKSMLRILDEAETADRVLTTEEITKLFKISGIKDKMLGPETGVPHLLSFLTLFVNYITMHSPDLLKEPELKKMIKGFRSQQIDRLDHS